MSLTKKEKVVALLNTFNTGDQHPISYINPTKYIQHNLAVADGLAGFGEVMKNAPLGGFKANVIRAFEDGNYVFTQTEYDFFGPKIGFDVFRFENDLIVEHWDNLIEIKPVNPSGRTQIDGATEIKDIDHTEQNKALIEEFVNVVLIGGKGIKMEFHKLHKIIGEGNFVLSMSEGEFAGAPTSYYDLFRIDNGKIAEHWDVMETILPESERKNTNGKF